MVPDCCMPLIHLNRYITTQTSNTPTTTPPTSIREVLSVEARRAMAVQLKPSMKLIRFRNVKSWKGVDSPAPSADMSPSKSPSKFVSESIPTNVIIL